MNLATLQIVAELCRVAAGDTNKFETTVGQIAMNQMKCHAFYASCLKDSSLNQCMEKRLAKQIADWTPEQRQRYGVAN